MLEFHLYNIDLSFFSLSSLFILMMVGLDVSYYFVIGKFERTSSSVGMPVISPSMIQGLGHHYQNFFNKIILPLLLKQQFIKFQLSNKVIKLKKFQTHSTITNAKE